MGEANARGDVSHVSRLSRGGLWTHPGRSAGPANRRARVGRGIQAVASPGLSTAESIRSGNMVGSYSRVEAYRPLPAWVVMEHSRTHKRSGDGSGQFPCARCTLYRRGEKT